MKSMRALPFVCLALLTCGCDETPTTAPVDETQGIAGQVISKEADIRVAAWQAHEVKSTIADSAGYFLIDGLPVGVYEVRLATPKAETLTIRNVTVQQDRITSLLEIRMNPPSWPLYDIFPPDSARGIPPLSPDIRIVSTQVLDLASLESSVSFTPPITGQWGVSDRYYYPGYSPYYYYSFQPASALDVATKYVMTIGPGLAVSGGQAWNDSLSSTFFTDSLRVLRVLTRYSYGGDPNLLEPRRAFTLIVQFNALVDSDSLTKATSFTPPIAGVWLDYSYSLNETYLSFFHTGNEGLHAEQTYLWQIDGDVPLVGSFASSHDMNVPLRTAALRVLDTYPSQGDLSHCRGCPVGLLFNSEMDSTTLAAAVTLSTLAGTPVPGQPEFSTSDIMYFNPDSVLLLDTVYVARISTGAASQWGDHLKETFELYFRVR